ncbi:MAG: YicC family protein [Ruminococcaceae bacterium]|nr:YicC family protein [Oscillospiraceae bacterium]
MKSMTAFGRATAVAEGLEITVELRSVNNRYADINIRTPKIFSALEEKIKAAILAGGVSRGKIDLSLSYSKEKTEDATTLYEADVECARSYVEAARLLSKSLGVKNDLTASALMKMPGVMLTVAADASLSEAEEDAKWATVAPVINKAVEQFVEARQREGDRIAEDIRAKLDGIRKMAASIAEHSEENITSYRKKFEERLKNAIADNRITLDESRILTECAIYADKAAIDEELVRLSSHFVAFEELLADSQPVGRRIDFLLQEINREINTIGSKCVDAEIAHTVVNVKSELEKIREQIQNIE